QFQTLSRPRRQQVSRACSWCQTYRIKCDDKVPCRNCVTKGRQCTEKGSNEVRTFSHAVKEINRLKSRVTELESQLNQLSNLPSSLQASSSAAPLPEYLDPLREHGGNRGSWEYAYSTIPNSQQAQCYGPSSSFYFMRNMSMYIKKSLLPTYPLASVQNNTHALSSFGSVDFQIGHNRTSLRRTNSTGQKPLSRWQEEYFLEFFWQSYHLIYPIIDAVEFRAHHNSIWIMPYEPRKPSALVDIILAVAMQYATALAPADLPSVVLTAEEKGKDAANAGRSYYRRCQALVADELESPSLITLQCHIFSVIYLSNASSYNTAHSTLALACRVAVILGLHRESNLDELDTDERSFRRRVWWTLYALEIKAAMELGRPLAIDLSQVTCGLPPETSQGYLFSTAELTQSPAIDACFMSNLQFSKLILAARSVYVTFYDKCATTLGPSRENTIHWNPQALEDCAEYLSMKMEYLKSWLRNVPGSLRMKRKAGGESYSANGSPLDLQPTAPSFLQRQQLFLELHYHTVTMNLFRHFINFPGPQSTAPLTEANANSCVDHAMTIANIIHQMLTETNLLSGWLETFHWHGNAFISMVGYVLAYPTGLRTLEARKAIRKAIPTFDLLSQSLAMATCSAKMARELAAKVDLI
ncbi:hypothetical protein N431DRAFT_317364, partial [Stipitochalara longipes BDJ]